MASGLQSVLLDELLRAVASQSQLWLATHSIGMMRKARDLGNANPGSVVFIDFDGANFDLPQVLKPVQPDRPFWKRAMQIALDDLAGYVAPEQVILCEGGQHSDKAKFDAECYNEIFKTEYPSALFLGAGSSDDVLNDPRGVGRLMAALTPGVDIRRLIDRDDRTNADITTLQQQAVRVLTRRHIESYLLDDDVLTRLCIDLGDGSLAAQLLAVKTKALQDSVAAGGPIDDFKRIGGDVYLAAKALFKQKKLGNHQRANLLCQHPPNLSAGSDKYGERH
jgi:hypothetical protein